MVRMTNPFSALDKWLGLKSYKLLIRTDVKHYKSIGYSESVVLANITWDKRKSLWKSYGLTKEDIDEVVEEICTIKPLKGFNKWLNLIKVRNVISESVKRGRVVFLSDEQVKYTNSKWGYNGFITSYEDLARIVIDRYKKGFQAEDIVKIFKDEYNKRRKINGNR
jgi:hypothetical protein